MKILSHSDYKIRKHIAMILFLLVLDRCAKNISPNIGIRGFSKKQLFHNRNETVIDEERTFFRFALL